MPGQAAEAEAKLTKSDNFATLAERCKRGCDIEAKEGSRGNMATHPDHPTEFLTPRQLANRWQITPMTLRRWRKQGKIAAHFLGRGVRFAIEDVERFEAEAKA